MCREPPALRAGLRSGSRLRSAPAGRALRSSTGGCRESRPAGKRAEANRVGACAFRRRRTSWAGLSSPPSGSTCSATATAGAVTSRSRALPLILGLHQFVEAFVWLGLEHHVDAGLGRLAMWVYLSIAFVLLPVFVPVAVLLVEPNARRRLRMAPFVVIGVAVAAVLLAAMVRGPVGVRLRPYHLEYAIRLSHGGIVVGFYVLAVCGALAGLRLPATCYLRDLEPGRGRGDRQADDRRVRVGMVRLRRADGRRPGGVHAPDALATRRRRGQLRGGSSFAVRTGSRPRRLSSPFGGASPLRGRRRAQARTRRRKFRSPSVKNTTKNDESNG